jgi:hypothetical protein
MEEVMEEFIAFTEFKQPTHLGRAENYKQLLLNIAAGTWQFPSEFNTGWRNQSTRDQALHGT